MIFHRYDNNEIVCVLIKYHLTWKLEGMTGISASGALAYDAFQVLDSAFRKILKEKPFLFSGDNDIGKIW